MRRCNILAMTTGGFQSATKALRLFSKYQCRLLKTETPKAVGNSIYLSIFNKIKTTIADSTKTQGNNSVSITITKCHLKKEK